MTSFLLHLNSNSKRKLLLFFWDMNEFISWPTEMHYEKMQLINVLLFIVLQMFIHFFSFLWCDLGANLPFLILLKRIKSNILFLQTKTRNTPVRIGSKWTYWKIAQLWNSFSQIWNENLRFLSDNYMLNHFVYNMVFFVFKCYSYFKRARALYKP